MNMTKKLALRALFSLLLLCACQKERAEKAQDPLDENYQLIDRGDYSQAIQKLQTLSLKDSRAEVKVTLASAYAARGGIRIQDYWGFVVGFNAPLATADSLPVNASIESLQKIAKQAKGDIDPRDLKALGDFIQALAVWDRYKVRADSIPVVRGQGLTDLKQAVDILATVQTPGGRLYRGILNLILFKSYLTASGNFWLDFNKVVEQVLGGNTQILCVFNFEELLRWLNPISYHLIETLRDLKVAFPEESRDLERAQEPLQRAYGDSINAVSELRKKRTCQ